MAYRHYPAFLEPPAQPGGAWGVIFPDLPGCTSAGDSAEAAAEAAPEALALAVEAMVEDGTPLPAPSRLDAPVPDWLAEAVRGAPLVRLLVRVEIPGRAVRANITMDEGLLARLDQAAAASGLSRSGLIAQAVRELLRRDAA